MTCVSRIEESGMVFGPYIDGWCCFRIEKSIAYTKIQQNVQIAEFLLIHPNNNKNPVVWVVEAKSSTPHPHNVVKFDKFMNEIKEKLINAFSLGLAMYFFRHKSAKDELPEQFKHLNLSTTNFRFILVIKGHKEEWLVPIQEALINELRSTVKTWALSATPVAVMNDQMARQEGIISGYIE